jgi:hypothetical protein
MPRRSAISSAVSSLSKVYRPDGANDCAPVTNILWLGVDPARERNGRYSAP